MHITTNNLPCEAKIDELVRNALAEEGKAPPQGPESFTVEPVAVDVDEQAAWSIRSAVSATLGATHVDGPIPGLVPPPGVVGFKWQVRDHPDYIFSDRNYRGSLYFRQPIAITWLAWRNDGQANVTTSNPALIQKFELYWKAQYYAYATGYECRDVSPSEFTSKGGVVYTLVIDSGYLRRLPNSPSRYMGPTRGFCAYYLVDVHKTSHYCDTSMARILHQPTVLDSSPRDKTYRCQY